MAAPTFDVRKNSQGGALHATRADGECLRYRLDVVAASVADVVQSAGGWLYDRAMAGWEVTVLLPQRGDARALRILGVRALDFQAQLAALGKGSTNQTLAVSAEAFTADARVRDAVLQSLDNGLTEVALWGQTPQGWPLRINRAMTSGQHVLSAAARRFKGYALAAAGFPGATAGPAEELLCDACPGADAELVRLD